MPFKRKPLNPQFFLIFLCGLFGLIALPGSSKAGDFKTGSEVKVEQPHKEDLYIAAGKIDVNARSAKDLILAGGEVNVTDSVGADLMVSGGEVAMKGNAGDDIRIFGGEVLIEGNVGDDLILFGGDIEIGPNARIHGMLKVYGGSVKLLGSVEGDVVLSGGDLTHEGKIGGKLKMHTGRAVLAGTVMGKSILAARTLRMEEDAAFHQNVRYWRQKGKMDLSPYMKKGEAQLDPALKQKVLGNAGWTELFFGFWAAWLIYILSGALILFLLNFFLTRSFKRAGIALEHLGKSLGYGSLYVFGVPLGSLILAITVIGAPIALVSGTIWGLSMLFTHLLSAVVITNWLKVRYNKAWDRTYLFLISLLIYGAIKGITFIPYLGWLFAVFIVVASFGALLLARRARFSNRPLVRI